MEMTLTHEMVENGLGLLFKKKVALMDIYVDKGKLQPYPVQLVDKKGQQTIRDILGYFIEELSEAYEKAEETLLHLSYNNPERALISHNDFHEEMADAWEFLLELLVLSNIDYGSVILYYKSKYPDDLPPNWNGQDFLNHIFNLGSRLNSESPLEHPDPRSMFRVNNKPPFVALPKINSSLLLHMGNYCWEITNTLMKAKNLLKHKPWREQLLKVDINEYHSLVMKAFEEFIALNEWLEMTPDAILVHYTRKNEINLQRINNHY